MPMQNSVAPAGTTVQPGCSTLRLQMSSRYRKLLPTNPTASQQGMSGICHNRALCFQIECLCVLE